MQDVQENRIHRAEEDLHGSPAGDPLHCSCIRRCACHLFSTCCRRQSLLRTIRDPEGDTVLLGSQGEQMQIGCWGAVAALRRMCLHLDVWVLSKEIGLKVPLSQLLNRTRCVHAKELEEKKQVHCGDVDDVKEDALPDPVIVGVTYHLVYRGTLVKRVHSTHFLVVVPHSYVGCLVVISTCWSLTLLRHCKWVSSIHRQLWGYYPVICPRLLEHCSHKHAGFRRIYMSASQKSPLWEKNPWRFACNIANRKDPLPRRFRQHWWSWLVEEWQRDIVYRHRWHLCDQCRFQTCTASRPHHRILKMP